MPDSASFEDFVRGFNTVHPMCDFIDAGCGKECADEKIKGKLPQLFILSCIHFFFVFIVYEWSIMKLIFHSLY